jgi:hypothetical protein
VAPAGQQGQGGQGEGAAVGGRRHFLDMSREATAVMLDRVRHIRFGSWLLQYLEEELIQVRRQAGR